MTEADLQRRVLYRLKRDHWKTAHAGRGIVEAENGERLVITPMATGWPDIVAVRPGSKVLYVELKREQGQPTPEQIGWLQALNGSGAIAIIVRPSDLREGRVDRISRHGSPL